MKKKFKKALSLLTLICCLSSNNVFNKNIVSASGGKRYIVFIGQKSAQKSKFINQLCYRRNSSSSSSIKTTYNNEDVDINFFDTLPLDSTNFNENFRKYHKDPNLVVLTYNADQVVSGEVNLEDVLKFGYNSIKDIYQGPIAVLGISWEPQNLSEIRFDNGNEISCITEKIFQQKKQLAFSMIIGGGDNFGFNIDYFINGLCQATSKPEETCTDISQISTMLLTGLYPCPRVSSPCFL